MTTAEKIKERVIVFCICCEVDFSIPKGHVLHKERKCLDCFLNEAEEVET